MHILVRSQENYFYVEVEDNGVEFLKKIFHLYLNDFIKQINQEPEIIRKKVLDLALRLQNILYHAHEGIISVKSKVNKGTTFSFKISAIKNISYNI